MPKDLLHLAEGFREKIEELKDLNKHLKEEINKFEKKASISSKVPPKVTSKLAQIFHLHIERLGFQFLSYELLLKHVIIKF